MQTLPPGPAPANAHPRPETGHSAPLDASTIATRLDAISDRARAQERLLRQARGVLYALFDGGMFDTTPTDPDDRQRHEMGTTLLDLLRDRLDGADAGSGEEADRRPYFGSLTEALDALALEVRDGGR